MLQQRRELRLALLVAAIEISVGAFDQDPAKFVVDDRVRASVARREGGLEADDLARLQFQAAVVKTVGATVFNLVQIGGIEGGNEMERWGARPPVAQQGERSIQLTIKEDQSIVAS